jgi:hypothetical protein
MNAEFSRTRLSIKSRFIIAVICYILAALLQLLNNGAARPLTPVLLFVPCFFLQVKKFNGLPKRERLEQSKEEGWKPVTMTEVDRLTDTIGKIKKTEINFIYTKLGPCSVILFAVLAFYTLIVNNGIYTFINAVYLYLVFLPFFWHARIEKAYPKNLAERLSYFIPLTSRHLPDSIKLVPYFHFDGGGAKAPDDLRFMLEYRENKELVGVQFQVSMNSGPHGKVPYMYAVFITRGQNKLWKQLREIEYDNFITESKPSRKEKDYGTVVLRLDTECRGDGYHTKDGDIQRLIDHVLETLERVKGR